MPESSDKLVQEIDPREALAEVLRAIRRNAVRVAFTTALFLMLGLFLTMLWPNKYESSTAFALRDWQVIADVALREDLQDIPVPKKIKALENELRSRMRIEAVMNDLQWTEWLETAGKEVDRRTLTEKLGKNLEVEIIPDVTGTQNIRITFQWTSPKKAADFVNNLRDKWIQLTMDGYKKSLDDAKDRMEAVLKDRKADYEAALAARRTYEQENAVPALLDQETNNLLKGEMITRRQTAEAEHEAVEGEIRKLTEQLKLIPREIEKPVPVEDKTQAEAMVKVLDAEAALEAATDPVSGYTKLHWKRIRAQNDYDEAVAALLAAGGTLDGPRTAMQTNEAYFAVATQLEEAQGREARVRGDLDSIERALDEAQANLDRLPVVTQDLATLDADITVKGELVLQTEAEIQPLRERVLQYRATNFGTDSKGFDPVTASPFEILEKGVEPERAVLPISAIVMAMALLIGLGVGALVPVLTEITRSSFGTVREVSRSLGVPVLGAVDLILTARDVRARRVQQALTWATMLLVLVALGTALYIYQAHPEDIPTALRRVLRDVRMALT